MADYVILGLVRRRAELTGESDDLRARIAQIGTDLGHLDAVIRQFDPEHDVAGIRSKRPRSPDAARRGEMSRAVLSVLREASEPLSTVEVAERLGKAQGVDIADKRVMRLLIEAGRDDVEPSAGQGDGTVANWGGDDGALGGGNVIN